MLRALGEEPGLKDIPTEQLQDEVIATLLLHDLIKNGKGLNAQGYPFDRGVTGTHGVVLAEKIDNEIDASGMGTESYIRMVTGIAIHMGIWTTKRYNTTDIAGLDKFIELIHLADYCASRKVDEIYSILGDEKNDSTQNTTKETYKSPPCPGIRPTESCQTTAAENGQ